MSFGISYKPSKDSAIPETVGSSAINSYGREGQYDA